MYRWRAIRRIELKINELVQEGRIMMFPMCYCVQMGFRGKGVTVVGEEVTW